MRFYGDINKIDEEQRMVYGYASTEAVDGQGEIVAKEAIAAALDDYMQFANIREMHQLSAVGTAEEAEIDDRGLYIAAHVVDDKAWAKIKGGVYKGFSVGGRALERDKDNRKKITKMSLSEISLVDRPCNPEARFDVFKVDEEVEKREFTEAERKKDAKSGHALPDGSFPIDNVQDLKNAIHAYGRAKDKPKAKAHIIARAKALGQSKLIPENWKAEDDSAAPDPVAKAQDDAADALAMVMATLERMEKVEEARAVPPVLVEGIELRKGMGGVSRLGCLLGELAFSIFDTEMESQMEGDNSPVPAKLREAFTALVAAYKAMSDEEVAELVASVDNNTMARAALSELAKVESANVEGLSEAVGSLVTKGLIEINHGPVIAKLQSDNDALCKTVGDLTDAMRKLHARVEELAAQPMPPKASTVRSVSKADDVRNSGGVNESEILKILAAFQALPEDKRVHLMMRAAQQNPMKL